jgi:hypothetical protein
VYMHLAASLWPAIDVHRRHAFKRTTRATLAQELSSTCIAIPSARYGECNQQERRRLRLKPYRCCQVIWHRIAGTWYFGWVSVSREDVDDTGARTLKFLILEAGLARHLWGLARRVDAAPDVRAASS